MDVLANNLANINTPGFKADQMHFSEVLAGTAQASVQAGQHMELTQGTVAKTGNPLDLAISGDGYFVVDTPEGDRFTRDGMFTLDAAGMLVTAQGRPVLGQGGPIAIDANAGPVTVTNTGEVWANGAQIATLQIVDFDDPASLRKAGNNLLEGGDPVAVDNPQVIQGAVEGSNVTAVREMARMIEISRAYETYQKILQTVDTAAGQTNGIGDA